MAGIGLAEGPGSGEVSSCILRVSNSVELFEHASVKGHCGHCKQVWQMVSLEKADAR